MPPTLPPLSSVMPPLICGTATFNNLYNPDISKLPTDAIVQEALDLGVRAFDTSPYYGPSEILLGNALNKPYILANHPRSTYHLVTKVGRIANHEFDYSPSWVRYSIRRSLTRLRTSYLDVVYCHDVEFVSPTEVLAAITELRRIRDEEGTIKYIGISGYPLAVLCSLAELILTETGEPLDCVMSYANYTLQNTTLLTTGLARLQAAGVGCVPNASVLGMGLLRSAGVPIGGKGDFHPAPNELRQKCMDAAHYVESTGERLETASLRWGLESWAIAGKAVGGVGGIGVSVMGVSNLGELEETMRVWNSVLDVLDVPERKEAGKEEKEWSLKRRTEVEEKAKKVWEILGEWKDFTWASPEEGFVNVRTVMGAPPEEPVVAEIQEAAKL